MSTGLIIVLGLACFIFAVVGLFRPFIGILVFIVIHFVQPGELIPALAPFRIELVYGLLLFARIFQQRASHPGPPILSDNVFRGALYLLGAAVLSVPFSVWPGGAADMVLDLVKHIALILLFMLVVDSQSRLRQLLWCVAAVATWFAGSSLSAFAHGDFYKLEYNLGALDRAQGINSIVGGPNELAGLLLALLPLLVVLLRCTRNVFARILLIVAGAALLAGIALTGSRIAIIGLLAMGIYYTFQSKRRILTGVICAVIGVTLWSNLPNAYKERYLTVESYAEGGQLDASNELRLKIWEAGETIFLRRPILGVGAGQFPVAYGLFYLKGRHAAWMQPHNLLIETSCELGIVGLVALFYFLWQIAKSIGAVLEKKNDTRLKLNYEMALACAVMFVGVAIESLVGHTLFRPYWYLLAGFVAANRNVACSFVTSPEVKPASSKEVQYAWRKSAPKLAKVPIKWRV